MRRVAVVSLCALLGSCGKSGIVVGSKQFTESVILGLGFFMLIVGDRHLMKPKRGQP